MEKKIYVYFIVIISRVMQTVNLQKKKKRKKKRLSTDICLYALCVLEFKNSSPYLGKNMFLSKKKARTEQKKHRAG